MYTPMQASKIKQQFWTVFGKYMAPILSAEGEKINWINYKTGISNLNFKMNAGNDGASISIEILCKEPLYAKKIFDQFVLFKSFLELYLGEKWQWKQNVENDSMQTISSISKTLAVGNIFCEDDWPVIISFLKPRIIALDKFWCDHKMIFEMIH